MADARRSAAKDAGKLEGARILIVESRFYEDIADALLAGALNAVHEAGAVFERLSVPGALELAPAIVMALDAAEAAGQPYEGVVALGCVIRGETLHFEIVSQLSARALLDLSVAHLERLAHAALPWLKQRGGTLIAFASDAGRFAAPRQALLGASRAAIIGFVRNLAVEVARDGVRVHCISPSFVVGSDSARRLSAQNSSRIERATARAGLGLPTPEDIAPTVLFLCGEGARKITGQVISINGGLNA